MKNLKIPVGRSGFADIRKNQYYFVDKSGLIEELLRTDATQVTLITRPRRFGKTLGMSMLAAFFDIRISGKELFKGLAVLENQELCAAWMNRYPVLFLSFRSVDGLDFEGAYAQFASVIAELYKEHFYLMESEQINTLDKEMIYRIASKKAGAEEVKNSLLKLTQLMAAHYGKPVILLIDEYDVPLAKASEKDYYPQMLDMVKGIMQVIKDNEALKFAVITGCLRITKESIFTGANNFVSDTISDTRLNEYFGFTQKEVNQLLREADLSSHEEEMREWYDGYHFGEFDIYCPWDVVNHVNQLLLNPGAKPAGYWKNSSDNAIIRSFIDYSGDEITKKFESLLSGETVIQKVELDLSYNYLHSSQENLWSILYLTGYLTRVREGKTKGKLPKGSLELAIPNAEIMEIFETTISKWFEETARQWDRQALFAAVWNGDAECVTDEMTRLLRKTISYHDYKEDFYHAFFAGIFAGAGYNVESNREHGEGRSDIIVQDYAGDRAAVFEVKYSNTLKELSGDCSKALAQIDERMYAEEFEEDYSRVVCYGMSFYKKRCLVKKKQTE